MKKFISIISVLCLVLCTFIACGKKEKEYSLSLGTVLTAEDKALGQEGTSAAVITDPDGKILLCRVDCIELSTTVIENTVTARKAPSSKHEAGDAYGMTEYSDAIAEWYSQAEHFEKYVIGKTLAEVEATKADNAELTAGCTIDVSDFIAAITAAVKSKNHVKFSALEENIKLGIAVEFSVSDSNGNAEFLYNTSAVALNGDKLAGAIIDSAESSMTLSDGKVQDYIYKGTKNELRDSYGMVEHGGASAEWYKQAEEYAKIAVGKTATELSSLPTENIAGCTIKTEPLKAVLIHASENVR